MGPEEMIICRLVRGRYSLRLKTYHTMCEGHRPDSTVPPFTLVPNLLSTAMPAKRKARGVGMLGGGSPFAHAAMLEFQASMASTDPPAPPPMPVLPVKRRSEKMETAVSIGADPAKRARALAE